jgi:hypothetical protein
MATQDFGEGLLLFYTPKAKGREEGEEVQEEQGTNETPKYWTAYGDGTVANTTLLRQSILRLCIFRTVHSRCRHLLFLTPLPLALN